MLTAERRRSIMQALQRDGKALLLCTLHNYNVHVS